jgi:phosphatidylglycerophosphatase A
MSPESRWVPLFVTWFGCGRSKLAPGTVGSLGAVPLHLLLRLLPPPGHALAVVALSVLGIWASGRYADALGEKDPPSAVIDEVAGTLIALGLVRRHGLLAHGVALALFRALDIVKPGPIDTAQRAEPAGLGIMLDDLLAGLGAGIVTRWLWRGRAG